MNYKGKIKNLNHIVISDPSYEEGVWCRYERKNLNERNWFVDIEVNDINEEYKGFTIKGTEYRMLLQSDRNNAKMLKDAISHSKKIKIEKTDIGVDTACVALGINEYAKEIINSKDEWQPDCSLKTLTDGIVGEVIEGKQDGKMSFLFITGSLCDDVEYTKEAILDYLVEQFQIEELEKVKSNDKELI